MASGFDLDRGRVVRVCVLSRRVSSESIGWLFGRSIARRVFCRLDLTYSTSVREQHASSMNNWAIARVVT
jgi:hypothetical protein